MNDLMNLEMMKKMMSENSNSEVMNNSDLSFDETNFPEISNIGSIPNTQETLDPCSVCDLIPNSEAKDQCLKSCDK